MSLTERTPLLAASNDGQTTAYLYSAALLSAIGGFLFGYDTGVVSGALLQLRDYFQLDTFWQELVVSITIAGAWMFACCAGKLNDIIGRKYTVIIASTLFTVGSGLMAGSQGAWSLLIGRWVVGLGVGLSSMTVPLYIAEVSPTKFRGKLVTVNQLFITGGQFAAGVIDGVFSSDKVHGWRYMLGLAAVPAVFQLIGFMWMPESPRWMAGKGRHQEAYEILRKLRGKNADIEDEFNDIKATAKGIGADENGFVLGRVWADSFLRRRLIVGVMLMVFQQMIAINTVMYYSASIIEMAGFRDQTMAIWLAAAVAFVNFVFSIVGVMLVEHVGRRKLTLSSLVGVTASLLVLAVGFYMGNTHSPAVTNVNGTSICSVYTDCRSCIDDDDCSFFHNVRTLESQCVLREINDTVAHHVDWMRETEVCPVPSHLGWITFSGLALYLVFFAPGMGPMPWTVNSELFPLWCRSTCFSVSTSFNWLFNLVVSMTFLSITHVLTQQGAFLLYAACGVLAFIFFYIYQPETKGTSLENLGDDEKSSTSTTTATPSTIRIH